MLDFTSFHKLSYGLYIICSAFDGKKSGYCGNTGFQVTASPSTIAVSCNKDNFTCGVIQKSRKFSLSVLQRDLDVSIVGDFGFKSTSNFDKFAHHEYKTGQLGIPVVTEWCNAAFECEVKNEVDCGTHILFIGEVVTGEKLNDLPPLTYEYYHEHYKMLSPKNAPTYIAPENLIEEKSASEEVVSGTSAEHIALFVAIPTTEQGDPANGIPPGTPLKIFPKNIPAYLWCVKEYFKEI